MRADLDTILSVRDAALWFTKLRGSKVSTHTVYAWVSRYELVKNGAGYRYGDLLRAEARARRGARETQRVA
jgi:hypothetical protein